ncbi:protein pangolin, isoforms A/H/I/S-like [Solenopsis invicta]|uniref:protein pangolin, isoforms A/H/I/S-like n=1 Tax=Solenopsis invicta TaxID=13686 RepID=UPI00193E9932|nr:protein pangolin, isoforms A/H/I/S-like [Solenopsis invicta]
MPHVSSSGGGDDLGSEDEVKVFKDEGEEEKRSSENLTEDKSDLIDLTESEEKGTLAGGTYATTGKTPTRSDLSPVFGKVDPTPHTSSFNMGYLVSPYPYPNGAGGPIPVSMVSSIIFSNTHFDASTTYVYVRTMNFSSVLIGCIEDF